MINEKKHIVYVCHQSKRPPGIDDTMNIVSKQANAHFERVDTIREILGKVGQFSFEIDLIIIEVSALLEAEGSTMFDIINTLTTLLRYRQLDDCGKTAVPAVAVAVDGQTSLKLIREVMLTANVAGIYPSGFAHTIPDKIEAIQHLLLGNRHIPKPIKERLAHKTKLIAKTPIVGALALTPRQHQIFELVTSRGASNKTIANILHITDSTVKLHMTSILKKCGVRTRTQLVAFTKHKLTVVALPL